MGRGPRNSRNNADTPTSVFETAVFQWMWLEDAKARHTTTTDADQYNSLHERLIEGWKEIGTTAGGHLHLAGALASPRRRTLCLSGGHRAAGRADDDEALDGRHRPQTERQFVDLQDKPTR